MKYPEWKESFVPPPPTNSVCIDEFEYCWKTHVVVALEEAIPQIKDLEVWHNFENVIAELGYALDQEFGQRSTPDLESIKRSSAFATHLGEIRQIVNTKYEPVIEIKYERDNALALTFPSTRMRERYLEAFLKNEKSKFSKEAKDLLSPKKLFAVTGGNVNEQCIFTRCSDESPILCVAAFRHGSPNHIRLAFSNLVILKRFRELFGYIVSNQEAPAPVRLREVEEKPYPHMDMDADFGDKSDQKLTLKIPKKWNRAFIHDPRYSVTYSGLEKTFVPGVIDIICEYVYLSGKDLPPPKMKLYRAKQDDFIGLVFSSEFHRNFFMGLFKDLGESFNDEQKKKAESLGRGLKQKVFAHNPEAKCMVTFEDKGTVYIPAFKKNENIYAVFNSNHYLKRFCNLVDLGKNSEPKSFFAGHTFIMFKDKKLFDEGYNIPLTGAYEQPEESSANGLTK